MNDDLCNNVICLVDYGCWFILFYTCIELGLETWSAPCIELGDLECSLCGDALLVIISTICNDLNYIMSCCNVVTVHVIMYVGLFVVPCCWNCPLLLEFWKCCCWSAGLLKKIRVSGYPFGFRVSAGFGFGHEFAPELEFGSGLGFKFGFRFWVPRHSTRTEPDPLPSLCGVHEPQLHAEMWSRSMCHCLVGGSWTEN